MDNSKKMTGEGSLTRANKLIVGKRLVPCDGSSVFTLHHWTTSCPEDDELKRRPEVAPKLGLVGGSRLLARQQLYSRRRARLSLFKLQEATLNFLLRWLEDDDYLNAEQRRPAARAAKRVNDSATNINRKQRRHSKDNRSSLLFESLAAGRQHLPDRRLPTIAKFVFRRWLTWTNVLELLLLIFLAACCGYQCYLLLDEYFEYPTHVHMTKVFNTNFRKDLPAVTLCNNNQMSRLSLAQNFPHLNYSHYLAISRGTFHSPDNFTLESNSSSPETAADEHEDAAESQQAANASDASHRSAGRPLDWTRVLRFLVSRKVYKLYKTIPDYDLVETITCANIWGDQLPCESLRRVESLQQSKKCSTLFHESVFWDQSDEAVRRLEAALGDNTGSAPAGSSVPATDANELEAYELLELEQERNRLRQMGEDKQRSAVKSNKSSTSAEMLGNMEMIRIRVRFRSQDYTDNRSVVGGTLAIHSNALVGAMNHIVYHIEPGYWYNFYIERFDYARLPPPYNTNCYDYKANRRIMEQSGQSSKELLGGSLSQEQRMQIMSLIKKQAAQPHEPLADYVDYVRRRSLSGRECMHLCSAELPASKCNCWPRGIPYLRDNNLDINGTMHYCDHGTLMRQPNASQVDGDDLYYQLCAKDFSLTCVAACPDECNFSSFDVTEQARYWPSHESRRYIKDQALLARLKEEAECCATVSVIYASPASSYHVTEAKYTIQDIVTVVSGNIEAWVGLSAVHAYLFLEQFYDALVEAQLISAPPTTPTTNGSTDHRHHHRFNWLPLASLISILTKFKLELSRLFIYIFQQLVFIKEKLRSWLFAG